MNHKLEACVTSFDQAIASSHHGASRLEICNRLETGGMTPEFEMVDELCRQINIPVRILIRSTPIGFEASNETLNDMIDSIEQFKKLPIDGFVIGLLKNSVVDRTGMEKIFEHTFPLPTTFHKAIDESQTIFEDLEWMNHVDAIDTILTSGGAENAFLGIERILQMKSIFKKTIIAGGKILPQHLESLHSKLNLEWYHGRNIVNANL